MWVVICMNPELSKLKRRFLVDTSNNENESIKGLLKLT